MCKVSIIIPVYKVEKYIEYCLQSVLEQTFQDWECILVDDGSPDQSGKICDQYVQKDSRFKVIHKKNGGVSSARNEGLKYATGQYVFFMDSDDYVDKMFLEYAFTNNLRNEDLAVYGYTAVYEDGHQMQWRPQIVGNYDLNSTENIRNILLHNLLNTIAGALWNKLFKLDLIRRNNLSFCEDIVHSEDALFVMSYFLKTNSVSLNEHTFYYYVRREGQATGTIRAKKFIQNIILVHQELQLYIQNEDLNYENDFSILFLRNLYDAIQDYWNILLIQNRRIYSLNSIRKNIKASITDWNWFCYTIKAALESCDPQYSHCNLLELKFLKYIIDGNYKHISLYHRIVLMLRLEKFKGMISRHGIIHVIRKLLFIKR